MQKFTYILLPITLSVIGEFLLKFSAKNMVQGISLDSILFMCTNIGVLSGVALILCSAVLWIIGMSKFQLSFMYPFLCINYSAIIFGSAILLNEQIPFSRYVSLVFIIIGLVLISRSPNTSIKE
jgi:multidrug transporter EmrE-like cation transporter